MTGCDISVIIPVRDAAATIERQLEALSDQQFAGSWELIVADNGSTDDSVELALRWCARIPGLRVIDAAAATGSYAARNLGAHAARGAALAFCDADDVVGPRWLEAMAAGLDRAPLLTGPIELEMLNGREVVGWRRKLVWERLPDWHGFLPGALTSNLGVRREVFEALGGFKPAPSGSDLRFVWRAQLAGWKLEHAAEAFVHRREPVGWYRYARRSFRYGAAEPRLYEDFRTSGMPRSSLFGAAARWLVVLLGWPTLAMPGRRYAWLDVAGQRAGRLASSLRERTLYL